MLLISRTQKKKTVATQSVLGVTATLQFGCSHLAVPVRLSVFWIFQSAFQGVLVTETRSPCFLRSGQGGYIHITWRTCRSRSSRRRAAAMNWMGSEPATGQRCRLCCRLLGALPTLNSAAKIREFYTKLLQRFSITNPKSVADSLPAHFPGSMNADTRSQSHLRVRDWVLGA